MNQRIDSSELEEVRMSDVHSPDSFNFKKGTWPITNICAIQCLSLKMYDSYYTTEM